MGRQDNIFFLTPSIFEGGRASIYTRWFSDLTSADIVEKQRREEKTEWGILGYPKTVRDLPRT